VELDRVGAFGRGRAGDHWLEGALQVQSRQGAGARPPKIWPLPVLPVPELASPLRPGGDLVRQQPFAS
jgi:hypothetical protein